MFFHCMTECSSVGFGYVQCFFCYVEYNVPHVQYMQYLSSTVFCTLSIYVNCGIIFIIYIIYSSASLFHQSPRNLWLLSSSLLLLSSSSTLLLLFSLLISLLLFLLLLLSRLIFITYIHCTIKHSSVCFVHFGFWFSRLCCIHSTPSNINTVVSTLIFLCYIYVYIYTHSYKSEIFLTVWYNRFWY